MLKQNLLASIKYFIGALVGTMAVLSLWPWYLNGLESHDASKSLSSIKNAGSAIKTYEQEWNKLPPRNSWVDSTRTYGEITQDPTYVRLTGEDQPENPGWGMNARINLSIGKQEELPKNVKSTDFPNDAILIAPSYQQAIFPQRNGELPLQDLSKNNNTPTQHGLRLGATKHHLGVSGLYLQNDGSVKQLSLQSAKELLSIRPIPPSKRAEIEKNIAYSDEVPWEPSEGAKKENGKILLKRGEVSTPLIPAPKKGEKLTITLKTTSDSLVNFLLSVEYFNQFKFPVNVRLKGGKLPMEAKLVEIYAGKHFLETDRPIANKSGESIGFNPSFGFSDPVIETLGKSEKIKDNYWKTEVKTTDANFTRGTVVTWARDLSQKFREKTDSKSKQTSITIIPDNLPEETEYINLKIKNNISSLITIESVKISRK
jgi:hypothetical protein